MPSASLLHWQNDRMPRLTLIDGQSAAVVGAVPPNPQLIDESLRSYVMVLSAHFQGYCRDLYTECAQIVVRRIRPSLQVLVQDQFTSHLRIDHGNPNLKNL